MELKEIGLLDFGLRYKGNLKEDQIFQHFIKESVIADNFGFSRKWLTEHYQNKSDSIWLSPEMLIPIIAAYTKRIKIGIAGVLSLYRSPIQVAGDYKLINNIFKDRIDLGFAKGAIRDAYEQYYQEYRGANDLNWRSIVMGKISSTISLLKDEPRHYENGILVPPYGGRLPELWNLVSSGSGYLDSMNLDVNCSRTLFFTGANLDPRLEDLCQYREAYFKQNEIYPKVNIVVTGTCQKTDKLCREILQVARNKRDEINEKTNIFGTPNKVFDHLNKLAETYNVDEIIFLENSRVFKHRIDSLKNISKIFKLPKNNLS